MEYGVTLVESRGLGRVAHCWDVAPAGATKILGVREADPGVSCAKAEEICGDAVPCAPCRAVSEATPNFSGIGRAFPLSEGQLCCGKVSISPVGSAVQVPRHDPIQRLHTLPRWLASRPSNCEFQPARLARLKAIRGIARA